MAVRVPIPSQFTNLDIRDTLNAYGGSVGDVSSDYFSERANINPSSARKPIHYPNKIGVLSEDDYKSMHYGFDFRQILPTTLDQIISVGSANYILPRGGIDSPYRIADFIGYDPTSLEVTNLNFPDTLRVRSLNNIKCNYRRTNRVGGLTIDKIANNGAINNAMIVLGNSNIAYFKYLPFSNGNSSDIWLILEDPSLDWSKIGRTFYVAIVMCDTYPVNAANKWKIGTDYGQKIYNWIVNSTNKIATYRQYTLPNVPQPGSGQYEVVGSTDIRIDATDNYPVYTIRVHDKASAGISALRNKRLYYENYRWDKGVRYSSYPIAAISNIQQPSFNEFIITTEIQGFGQDNSPRTSIGYSNIYIGNENGDEIYDFFKATVVKAF